MSDETSRLPIWRRRGVWIVLILAAYSAIVLTTTLRHEAWYDETEPWLVARDGSLSDLNRITPAIGVPAFWFLTLMPAAKLGAPVIAMGLINAAFAIAAIYVLLRYAPLQWPLKVVFTFGFFALYEFGVIARPYAAMMLFLFATAAVYPIRWRRPVLFAACVALVANVTPHTLVVAAAFALVFTYEWLKLPSPRSRAGIVAVAIMLVAGLCAAWQLRPQSDEQLPYYTFFRFPVAYIDIAKTLFYFPHRNLLLFGEFSRMLASLAIAGLVLGMLDRPKALFIFVLSMAWLMYLYHFKWFQAPRHSGIVLLVILVCQWLSSNDRRASDDKLKLRIARAGRSVSAAVLTIGLAVSCYHSAIWTTADWQKPFSTAPEMAVWIHDHVPRDRVIIGDPFFGTVSAHLGADWRVWVAARQEFGSFHTWTGSAVRMNDELSLNMSDIVRRAERAFPSRRFVIVTSMKLPDGAVTGYELHYQTHGRRIGYYYEADQYFLYRPVDDVANASAVASFVNSPVPSS